MFNHAQTYLFLGAAIITSGIISGLFAVLRRSLDPLLLWFALLAVLYGGRLEMNYQLLWALGVRPLGFQRVVIAIGFLVPIPAFFFFRELNLLGRAGRIACAIVWPVASVLAFATLVLGPRSAFRAINNSFVVAALIIIFIALVRTGSEKRDLRLIRRGLLLFIACAVYDNVTMFVGRYDYIEPFSFVVLLICLGVVAARRTLANEQQLTVIQRELEIAQRIQSNFRCSRFHFPRVGDFRLQRGTFP